MFLLFICRKNLTEDYFVINATDTSLNTGTRTLVYYKSKKEAILGRQGLGPALPWSI